jgi:phenylacetaldehyde dehydrogenase
MTILPVVERFLERDHLLLIDGEWTPAVSGKTFASINPATGKPLATVACAEKEDIDRAVAAARRALTANPWKQMGGTQRSRLLWRVAELIDLHAEELAQLESLDQGKPVKIARIADVAGSAESFRYMAGWATKLTGATIPVGAPGAFHTFTVKEPVGVVGQIVPWNFPLAMAAWKLAPALAAGCTVVLKPAENTPLSTLRLGELMIEAGFPAGTVNIVPGFGTVAGAAIAEHPGIDKVAFTGSTAVGKRIVVAAGGNLKRVTLELGGKNPTIVLPDADLAKAIPSIVQGAFTNCGQVCTAASRALVHRSVLKEVTDGLIAGAQALRVGPGMENSTDMGPVVSEAQMNAILGHIRAAEAEGAVIATGGMRLGDEGYFLAPTVITDTTPEMKINREEVFGPVISVVPFDDIEEAIAIANATEYGLTAQVWTRDITSAHRFSNALDSGSIWINGKSMDIALPFGGFKQSGWGMEKGAEGIDIYTRTKTVVHAF